MEEDTILEVRSEITLLSRLIVDYGSQDPIYTDEHSRLRPEDYDAEHISGLDVFVQDLQKAIKGAFPRKGLPYPYTSVHALLVRWEDDDMGIDREIEKLASALRCFLNFEVEEDWTIPKENPQRALRQKLYTFQDAHQSEDELLIFYYGGHGRQDRYGRSIWRAYVTFHSAVASFVWSSFLDFCLSQPSKATRQYGTCHH